MTAIGGYPTRGPRNYYPDDQRQDTREPSDYKQTLDRDFVSSDGFFPAVQDSYINPTTGARTSAPAGYSPREGSGWVLDRGENGNDPAASSPPPSNNDNIKIDTRPGGGGSRGGWNRGAPWDNRPRQMDIVDKELNRYQPAFEFVQRYPEGYGGQPVQGGGYAPWRPPGGGRPGGGGRDDQINDLINAISSFRLPNISFSNQFNPQNTFNPNNQNTFTPTNTNTSTFTPTNTNTANPVISPTIQSSNTSSNTVNPVFQQQDAEGDITGTSASTQAEQATDLLQETVNDIESVNETTTQNPTEIGVETDVDNQISSEQTTEQTSQQTTDQSPDYIFDEIDGENPPPGIVIPGPDDTTPGPDDTTPGPDDTTPGPDDTGTGYDWDAAARGRVNSIYDDLLVREPDLAGETYWINQMREGATDEDVRRGIQSSPEYINRENAKTLAQTMENKSYERDTPTSLGNINETSLDAWIAPGGGLTQSSDPTAQTYFEGVGSLDNYVDPDTGGAADQTTSDLFGLYTDKFGRNPDEEGLGYWKDEVATRTGAGEDYSDVLSNIGQSFDASVENRLRTQPSDAWLDGQNNNTSDNVDDWLQSIYTEAGLGTVDEGGSNWWKNDLARGQTRDQVRANIMRHA